MANILASYFRDANRIPITTDGIISQTTQTLTGNNATVVTALFHVIGTVEIRGIWGVVTTLLGANHTTAFYRLNDQTAQVSITLNTGTTLSGAAAGSIIVKNGLVGAAVTLINNSAGRINEPTTLETMFFSPFVAVKKTAATTDIEYSYATTDTPTSGAIQHFVRWLPLSADGSVNAI